MFVFNIVTILYKPHHKQNCYENLATILRAVILSLYQFFVSLIDLWQSFVYLQLNLFVERIRKWSMEWLMEKLLPLIAPSNPIQPRGFDLDGLSIPARNWIPCHNHDTRSGDLPHKWVDWSLNIELHWIKLIHTKKSNVVLVEARVSNPRFPPIALRRLYILKRRICRTFTTLGRNDYVTGL